MLAAGHGYRETVSLLLARSADMKRRSASGKTARDFAARMGHPEVVQQLTKAEKTIHQAAK
jgi:ankyrin repeat protein